MKLNLEPRAVKALAFAWYSGQVQAYFVWLGLPIIVGMILRACLGGHLA